MAIRLTGTLTPLGDFPVCLVEDVEGAASEDYVDSAIAAIPDATASNKGLATAAQITKLDALPVAGAPVDKIDFSTVSEPAYLGGRLTFRDGYLNLMTGIGDSELRIGDEMQRDAYNGSASTLTDGSPVYLYAANTSRVDVRAAVNNGTTGRVLGLTTQSIDSHATGRITTYGEVHGLDTHDWSEGAFLYTSSVAGALTDIPVPGDKAGSRVAMVVVSSPIQGTLLVDIESMPRLAGTTANRPTTPRLGEAYFDVTLGYPVWWTGSVWQPAFRAGYTDILGTIDQATASASFTYEEYRDTPAIYSFFRHDQNDACTLKYQTPHNWTLTAVEPHVHVIPCGNTTGVLVLDGYIAWSRLGTQPLGALSSWTPFRVETSILGTSQWTSQAISLGSFTPPANAAYPSAVLHVYLRRFGADSADTYTASKPLPGTAAANVMLEFADCHIQILGFGTTGLYS